MRSLGIVKLLLGLIGLAGCSVMLWNILNITRIEAAGAAIVFIIVPLLLALCVIEVLCAISIIRTGRINAFVFGWNLLVCVLSFSALILVFVSGQGAIGIGLIYFIFFVFPYLICVLAKYAGWKKRRQVAIDAQV